VFGVLPARPVAVAGTPDVPSPFDAHSGATTPATSST
jgi:hypothetical protein